MSGTTEKKKSIINCLDFCSTCIRCACRSGDAGMRRCSGKLYQAVRNHFPEFDQDGGGTCRTVVYHAGYHFSAGCAQGRGNRSKNNLLLFMHDCLCSNFGTAFANLLNVGAGYTLGAQELTYEATEAPSFMDTLVNIFPSNAVQPLANATMLQVIVIALFFGFGIIVAGEKGKAAKEVVDSFSEVSFKVMGMIIRLSPIGVFALITPVVASNGPKVLLPLLKVIAVAYVTYIVHMVLVYSSTVKIISGMNPLKFFKGMSQAMIFAFSSASSVGALPFNLECTQKLGARKEVASFVLPLGATINMDGTAIYQGVCAIFIAQIFGIDLSISQQLTIILTATLASVGTAGVPGSGMIMLAMVLESVGLPLEGIALVAGIDRILDMGRTCVNITGDAACTICVDAMEKKKRGTQGKCIVV